MGCSFNLPTEGFLPKSSFMRLPLLFLSILVTTASAGLPEALQTIRAVAREGQGNAAATAAWAEAAACPAADLPKLLAALDDANPLAENWLRAAISAVEEKAAAAKEMPVEGLVAFVKDTAHSASARALGFDLLLTHAPAVATDLSPGFLNDVSSELRRHPITQFLAKADGLAAADKGEAVKVYRLALDAARDEDQIKLVSKKLRDLGEKVDLAGHFGFLMEWRLIAPFSNAERTGHDKVYPPEVELDFTKSYDGKTKPAKWVNFTSTDDYGMIDFNKPFGMEKEVTGYAAADFYSTDERDAEIRLGCKNAWKVWLNGKLVFARDEYHRGAKLDQYKLPVKLSKGKNTILVKCSQNEQKEEWTVEWEFQLRICDATGTAIRSSPAR